MSYAAITKNQIDGIERFYEEHVTNMTDEDNAVLGYKCGFIKALQLLGMEIVHNNGERASGLDHRVSLKCNTPRLKTLAIDFARESAEMNKVRSQCEINGHTEGWGHKLSETEMTSLLSHIKACTLIVSKINEFESELYECDK